MNPTRPLAALGLVAALALSACGGSNGSTASDGDQLKLGFITKYNNDFFLAMEEAVKEWDAANDDVEVVMGQGANETDIDGQIDLVESMVTQQVDGIAIAAVGEGVQPALESAAAQGVKIVLVNDDLADFEDKTATVTTDNFQGGRLAGEWIASQLKPDDTVAILDGTPGVPALDARTNGMIEGLGGKFEVVQKLATECGREKGVSATEDILAANPDVDAIYAACGPPALGAIEALENKNVAPDEILLVGFDALPDEAQAILAGKQDATVAQSPKRMGTLSLDSLVKAINGETVEKSIDTGTEIVTKENAENFTTFQ